VLTRAFPILNRVSLNELKYVIDQWFSTFVRPRSGKFFFYKTRARYRTAARRLRNTVIEDFDPRSEVFRYFFSSLYASYCVS
jgi:hypothetical protein